MPLHDPNTPTRTLLARAATVKVLGFKPSEIRKAIIGGLAAGVPLLAADLADLHLSRAEGGVLVGAVLLGGYAVFKVKNTPAE